MRYIVLGAKILGVAVIGGVVSQYVFGGSFVTGFAAIGISAILYVLKNRKRIL